MTSDTPQPHAQPAIRTRLTFSLRAIGCLTCFGFHISTPVGYQYNSYLTEMLQFGERVERGSPWLRLASHTSTSSQRTPPFVRSNCQIWPVAHLFGTVFFPRGVVPSRDRIQCASSHPLTGQAHKVN